MMGKLRKHCLTIEWVALSGERGDKEKGRKFFSILVKPSSKYAKLLTSIFFWQPRVKIKFLLSCLLVLVAVISSNFCFLAEDAGADTISSENLEKIEQLWQGSAHALAEVNCSSCHQDEKTKQIVAKPTEESCRSCHEQSVETFLLGKHGIRTLEHLSPLTPKMAHLPMQESAKDAQMTCNSCHNVHSVNTAVAATDSCLSCHNDNHSLNYKDSPHAGMVSNLSELPRPNKNAVTCATCHLPRTKVGDTVLVNHNNTYTLLPRDRMAKEVCINCHGLEHSYNSIFDDELVEANFARSPTQKMETFELVRALEKKRSSKTQ